LLGLPPGVDLDQIPAEVDRGGHRAGIERARLFEVTGRLAVPALGLECAGHADARAEVARVDRERGAELDDGLVGLPAHQVVLGPLGRPLLPGLRASETTAAG